MIVWWSASGGRRWEGAEGGGSGRGSVHWHWHLLPLSSPFKAVDPFHKVHVVMCLVSDLVILRKCDGLVILSLSQLSPVHLLTSTSLLRHSAAAHSLPRVNQKWPACPFQSSAFDLSLPRKSTHKTYYAINEVEEERTAHACSDSLCITYSNANSCKSWHSSNNVTVMLQ